jgi:signal transduction histidine kinase
LNSQATRDIISGVSTESWKSELESVSLRYVTIACWVGAIFDPIFAFTDYLNIPDHWFALFFVRLCVAAITLSVLFLRRRLKLTAAAVVFVPVFLISVQNAVVYRFIGPEHALGQNLNFMALMIGASLFVLWHWTYSVGMVVIAAVLTSIFVYLNPNLSIDTFFLQGGLLLAASGAFMVLLINARYRLTVREIKTRLALKDTVAVLESQAEEIRSINENLERLVSERTSELKNKNKAIEEYTFITAHKLRGPVASVLGLINIFRSIEFTKEAKEAVTHLDDAAHKLDNIVNSMIRAIEQDDTNSQ